MALAVEPENLAAGVEGVARHWGRRHGDCGGGRIPHLESDFRLPCRRRWILEVV
jgi:hypothetical protein